MARFVSVRELKNQATRLLRETEQGTTLIVTRRAKPVATVKPFDPEDLKPKATEYPTTLYDSWREEIAGRYPELRDREDSELESIFEQASAKVRGRLRP
jgi:prevent-host-death family protein